MRETHENDPSAVKNTFDFSLPNVYVMTVLMLASPFLVVYTAAAVTSKMLHWLEKRSP
jgi:hypothetical protein